MPEICDNSDGFPEVEPEELEAAGETSVELDELSVEPEELVELALSVEFALSVELEELALSVELDVPEELEDTDELEIAEEFSFTVPFEQLERLTTAAAAISTRIFRFKSNTSYFIIWKHFTIFRTICQSKKRNNYEKVAQNRNCAEKF